MTVKKIPPRYRFTGRLRPTHVARILSPSGVYPDRSCVCESGLLYVSESLCFSVAPYDPNEEQDFDFYSEFMWATLAEIRLYASVLLATNREESYVAIYPYRYPVYLYMNEPLERKSVQRRIRNVLTEGFESIPWNSHSFRGMDRPPAVGGPAYDLRQNALRPYWQLILASHIKTSDHLLMRGLSTLLRAVMLWQHQQFAEEATNTIFISLDASFQLVLRALEDQKIKNASATDAGRFISKAFFEETHEMRYFETFYDSRVMSLHPKSRFGTFPHAPLMFDDFMHLRDSLFEVYSYLIAGLIRPDYLEYVINHTPRSASARHGAILQAKRIRSFRRQNQRCMHPKRYFASS
jgi:hypothetical protein